MRLNIDLLCFMMLLIDICRLRYILVLRMTSHLRVVDKKEASPLQQMPS